MKHVSSNAYTSHIVWDIITFDIKSNLISFSFEPEYKILKQDFYFLYVLSLIIFIYIIDDNIYRK